MKRPGALSGPSLFVEGNYGAPERGVGAEAVTVGYSVGIVPAGAVAITMPAPSHLLPERGTPLARS
jgi:hypothetical protein